MTLFSPCCVKVKWMTTVQRLCKCYTQVVFLYYKPSSSSINFPLFGFAGSDKMVCLASVLFYFFLMILSTFKPESLVSLLVIPPHYSHSAVNADACVCTHKNITAPSYTMPLDTPHIFNSKCGTLEYFLCMPSISLSLLHQWATD